MKIARTSLQLLFSIVLLHAVAASAEDLLVVRRGTPKNATQVGPSWTRGPGYLEGSGPDIKLMANQRLGHGDAAIVARLSIDDIRGSSAAFLFNERNSFQFDGDGEYLVVEGPAFGNPHRIAPAAAHINSGQTFRFAMVRKDRELTFSINGQRVYQTEYEGAIGAVGLQPRSSTMRVVDLAVRGEFTGPFLRVFGSTEEKRHFFVWEGLPDDWLPAHVDTGAQSNIRPSDYAGPQACAECHEQNFRHWSQHSHRWMNAPAGTDTVRGDFEGARLEYYDGEVTFLRHDDAYVMQLERGELKRSYQVTQTIGSRFFQYYVGVQVEGPEQRPHAIYERDHLLPFGYWFVEKSWVPVVHVDGSREGEPSLNDDMRRDPFANAKFKTYANSCANCHTTLPAGDWLMRKMNSHQNSPHDFAFSMHAYLAETHAELLPADSLPSQLSDEQVVNVWSRLTHEKAPVWEVTSGISCEACHLGSKAHVEDPQRFPTFFPVSPHMRITTSGETNQLGRTSTNKNWICSRCHSGVRPEYAAGMATWNSVEYDDATKGVCYSSTNERETLTCVHCHNPHQSIGQRWTRTPEEDDASCLQCHEQFRTAQALQQHTHHAPDSAGSRCMECHMPRINEGMQDMVRTHMIFNPTDARMIEANQPNACNMCHIDKSMDWTLVHLHEWYGKSYNTSKLAASYDAELREHPATVGWLRQWHPATQMVAVDALTRANATWALAELIPVLDSEYLLNRQFALIGLQRMLGVDLGDYRYRFYMFEKERRAPLERIWKEFAPAGAMAPWANPSRSARQKTIQRELKASRGLLRLHPQSAHAHFRLARALERNQALQQAASYYQRAVELKPDYAHAHFKLGSYYAMQGDQRRAVLHYRQGLEHESIYLPAINNIAWILATSSDPELRDGDQALRHAEHAASASGHRDFGVLDTLAAAHAESGDFENAVRWQSEAIRLAPESYKADLRSRLNFYQNSQPFHKNKP